MAKYKLFGIPFFEIQRESRSDAVPTGTFANPTQQLLDVLGKNTIGTVSVNNNTALTLSAVWRAINVIASTLAGLPVKHYRNDKDGREHVSGSIAEYKLRFPNDIMTGYIFRETILAGAVGYGNGYAYIKRNGAGEVAELMPLKAGHCIPIIHKNQIFYKVLIDNQFTTVTNDTILHVPGLSFDGLVGYNPITVARESIGGALATQKFGNTFYENGATLGGTLEVPGELSEAAYKRLKESWHEKHHGADNTGKTAILEGGVKFTKIGIPPEEAQFLQTRQFQVEEIARWFGVPPHMLMDLTRSTNNNIEHQSMEFVTYTLMPWANRFEEEITRKLILPSRQKSEYFEFEFNGLLRADSKSRGEYYRSMFAIAGITPNQIAELENMPKFEGGDNRFIQAGYAPLNKIESFYEGKKGKTNENN